MSDFTSPPKDQTCAKCGTRTATQWWSEGVIATVHGFCEARCELCCIEAQLEHARKMAATIPALEAKLIELRSKVCNGEETQEADLRSTPG